MCVQQRALLCATAEGFYQTCQDKTPQAPVFLYHPFELLGGRKGARMDGYKPRNL